MLATTVALQFSNPYNAIQTLSAQPLIDPQTGRAFKLVGFDETLKRLRQKMPRVSDVMNAENAVQALLAGFGASDEILGGMASSNNASTGIIAGGLIASGLYQMYNFYSAHTGLQDLQEQLIKELPLVEIRRYEPRDTTVGDISAEDIIASLKKNGHVTITLTNDIKFSLKNNNIWSLRLLGGSVVSVGASAVFAGLFVKYQIDAYAQISDNDEANMSVESPEVWAALIGASTPLPKLYSAFVNLVYQQAANIFEAVSLVVKDYEQKNKIHEVPDVFLIMAGNFMDKEYKEANMAIKERAKIEDEKRTKQLLLSLGERARIAEETAAKAVKEAADTRLLLDAISKETDKLLHKDPVDDPEAGQTNRATKEKAPGKCVIC